MFLSVIIASKGRPLILAETVNGLSRLTRVPDEIILSLTEKADLPEGLSSSIKVIYSESGLTKQLNHAVKTISADSQLVTILDDDVELAPDYFEKIVLLFSTHSCLAGVHGDVLFDGDISRDNAKNMIKNHIVIRRDFEPCERLYGCNMSFRSTIIKEYDFDERLPLYGWLFEIPMSLAIKKKGRIVKYPECYLVHLRAKSSRMSDKRFGYAQIANPLYLWRHNQLSGGEAFIRYIAAALLSNLLKVCMGRTERIRGNILALFEWSAGNIAPERILKI